MYDKSKQDEEEDPLDAFMAGIESEVIYHTILLRISGSWYFSRFRKLQWKNLKEKRYIPLTSNLHL